MKIVRLYISLLLFSLCTFSAFAYQDGIRIAWDYGQTKFENEGVYGRVKKLQNGDLVSVYSIGSSIYMKRKPSGDNYWNAAIEVSKNNDGLYGYTNAELIELENGKLIYTWNARPKVEGNAVYKIMTKESTDNGKTWKNEKDVYLAGNTKRTGCWEPVFLQLPTGEVQLYFANEYTTPSGQQNITMLRSFDNGDTWKAPEVVSFRSGSRDGMAVPVYLQDEKGIVFAIEDNGIHGLFKPVIIHTSVADNWSSGTVFGNSPSRWHALHPDYRIASNIYAGAPYLIQLDSKETILAIQSAEGRSATGNEDLAIMQVYIGSDEAKDFTRKSTPFVHIPTTARALWNSLCQISDSTIMAVSSITNLSADNGIWSSIGKIVKPLEIAKTENVEDKWQNYSSIFIGSASRANLKLKSSWDADSLYLFFDVKDPIRTIVDNDNALWETDGVEVYLDLKNQNTDNISTGIYKILVNVNDKMSFHRSNNKMWEQQFSNAKFQVVDQKVGYTISLAIPWKDLDGVPNADFGIHLKLHNNDRNTLIVHEDLSGGHPDKPKTWLKSTLLGSTSGIENNTTEVNGRLIFEPSMPKSGEPFQITIASATDNLKNSQINIYDVSSGMLLHRNTVSEEFYSVDNLNFKGISLIVVDTESGRRIKEKKIIN